MRSLWALNLEELKVGFSIRSMVIWSLALKKQSKFIGKYHSETKCQQTKKTIAFLMEIAYPLLSKNKPQWS